MYSSGLQHLLMFDKVLDHKYMPKDLYTCTCTLLMILSTSIHPSLKMLQFLIIHTWYIMEVIVRCLALVKTLIP